MAQEIDSQTFEYVVGQEDLEAVSNEPAHDHAAHAHDHAAHAHDHAADDHDHAGHDHAEHGEENHDDHGDHEVNYLTGEGVNIGGFIFPEIFVIGTGGISENHDISELATTEHDPQNDIGIQAIEAHLVFNFNGVITGGIYGVGIQGNDEWEAALEEAFLHYHLTENLAIGGGQFLNTVGFQAGKHVHQWDFVNQNLLTSRMLNESELITQGGELILTIPGLSGTLTIGGGGVRSHAHEEEHEEEHHIEAENANFNDSVVSIDYKFSLPGDESTRLAASFVTGENGFGFNTEVLGIGVEKLWNAHDHGDEPEFGEGTFLLRSEYMNRKIDAADEEEALQLEDHGVSTMLAYGLNEATTLSIRHDWVSELAEMELEDRHRFSPALTTLLGPAQGIKARIQYDFNQSDSLGNEHTAWLQFQWQWGGHEHHDH